MLYDMTDGSLVPVDRTSFAAEKVLERTHLQAAVREHIEVLGDDLLVVAEEFGDFQDAPRRIDLLCVNKQAKLVVVELKRTAGGGHMELQAIRYAAMVSAMTFDELVRHYHRHLQHVGSTSVDLQTARSRLVEWIEEWDDEELVLSRRVAIVLASADFSQEITTTVLWLNDLYGTDIRCVRLSPYRWEGRLLLDVQRVIPLPEADALTVRLKKRESAARAASSGADWTAYSITTPDGVTEPLRKRRAILAMVHGLHAAGVSGAAIQQVIPGPRFLPVHGSVVDDELLEAFTRTYPSSAGAVGRWFLDEPVVEHDETWVLSKMWGMDTEKTLSDLRALAPTGGFEFSAS